jgi:hypothetical protein
MTRLLHHEGEVNFMRHSLAAFSIALSFAAPAAAVSQQQLNVLAAKMGARLQVLDNHPASCPGQAN